MAVLKFQLPKSCSSSSTKHTVKTVWRAQTFAPRALGSDGQNLKSTEQIRCASDLGIPGKGFRVRERDLWSATRTFLRTVMFTHCFTKARDSPCSYGGCLPAVTRHRGGF